MIKVFSIISNSIWLAISSFFVFIKNVIFGIIPFLKKELFITGNWLRKQLDKYVDPTQRKRLQTIIFESETKQGRRYDTFLMFTIVLSIVVVMLETVSEFHDSYWWIFYILEWVFTVVFTVEYLLRLYSSKEPVKYATSFFGMVDLLAIVPTYLGIFFLGAQHLLIVRALRLLRIFRIFKMGHFVREGEIIVSALKASKTKIFVFISFMVLLSMIIGSILYIVEGSVNPGLSNIPKGIYWAVVTLTTVGYGDVIPITTFGKMLATMVMIMGYGVIAVPTGIITAEISGRILNMRHVKIKECHNCGQPEHHTEAAFCHQCSDKL